MTRHLYLHIPFCQRRCSYCDFNTFANLEHRVEAYVDALCRDIQLANRSGADWRKLPTATSTSSNQVETHRELTRADLRPTVFLGGGTPTMLNIEQMERVLQASGHLVPLDQAEITTEANPGTVIDEDYLRGLRSLGINRISFGVQSLDDPTLRTLGRIHTADEAIATYNQARRAGFERINLDFIFGLPGQTLDRWRRTLDQVVQLGADHFSLYSLIVEEGTPLHQQVMRGSISVPDDDVTGPMYEMACERLDAAGYIQYEISNWALPGEAAGVLPAYASHHNVAYWLNADYLAFGAGAHGHVYPRRWHDLLGVEQYIAAVNEDRPPIADIIDLCESDLYAETMMMGLRLNVGVGFRHFEQRCGRPLLDVYSVEVAELVADGLLDQDLIGVRLTERGRIFGNRVFSRFVN